MMRNRVLFWLAAVGMVLSPVCGRAQAPDSFQSVAPTKPTAPVRPRPSTAPQPSAKPLPSHSWDASQPRIVSQEQFNIAVRTDVALLGLGFSARRKDGEDMKSRDVSPIQSGYNVFSDAKSLPSADVTQEATRDFVVHAYNQSLYSAYEFAVQNDKSGSGYGGYYNVACTNILGNAYVWQAGIYIIYEDSGSLLLSKGYMKNGNPDWWRLSIKNRYQQHLKFDDGQEVDATAYDVSHLKNNGEIEEFTVFLSSYSIYLKFNNGNHINIARCSGVPSL